MGRIGVIIIFCYISTKDFPSPMKVGPGNHRPRRGHGLWGGCPPPPPVGHERCCLSHALSTGETGGWLVGWLVGMMIMMMGGPLFPLSLF